jgi:hypothetical protein
MSSGIVYRPRQDATPEGELSALSAVYKFLLDCRAKKYPAAGPSERGKHDGTTEEASADEPIIRH